MDGWDEKYDTINGTDEINGTDAINGTDEWMVPKNKK